MLLSQSLQIFMVYTPILCWQYTASAVSCYGIFVSVWRRCLC